MICKFSYGLGFVT